MNGKLLSMANQESYLRDEGALESAVMRPQMTAYYEQADLIEQAATLMAGIALAHAFLDGNKRTSLVAGVSFLLVNGMQVVAGQLELGRQIEAIVNREGSLEEATSIFVEWLRPHVETLPNDGLP